MPVSYTHVKQETDSAAALKKHESKSRIFERRNSLYLHKNKILKNFIIKYLWFLIYVLFMFCIFFHTIYSLYFWRIPMNLKFIF